MARDDSLPIAAKRHPEIEGYSEILDRIDAGDKTALPQLREILDRYPDAAAELGDLTRMARSAIRSRYKADGLLLHAALEWEEEALSAEIAGPNPTTLERLLSDQVVLCWQHLRYLEVTFARLGSYTSETGDFYERCIDKAQRRFLQAIRTLAQIRKLGLPAMQVNIAAEGGKQVNVAG